MRIIFFVLLFTFFIVVASIPVGEPRTTDGIDYVLKPGLGQSIGVKDYFKSKLGMAVPMDVPPSIVLLNKRTPIAKIWQAGYGLDHLLRDGATIDTFLVNGYKWDDLCMFQDVGHVSARRSLETLISGLGMCANHLRDRYDQLPADKFRKLTKIVPGDFCRQLALQFKGRNLTCWDADDWNAEHCVRLGLNMEDLMRIGLRTRQQYVQLFRGLTMDEKGAAEKALGATTKLAAQLVDESVRAVQEEEDEEEEDIQQEEEDEPIQQQHEEEDIGIEQEYDDDEEEEDEEEETPTATSVAKKPMGVAQNTISKKPMGVAKKPIAVAQNAVAKKHIEVAQKRTIPPRMMEPTETYQDLPPSYYTKLRQLNKAKQNK